MISVTEYLVSHLAKDGSQYLLDVIIIFLMIISFTTGCGSSDMTGISVYKKPLNANHSLYK